MLASAQKTEKGRTDHSVHPALARSRAFVSRVWEREERPGLEIRVFAYAAFENFSVATLTRFEIGAKASL